MLDYLLFFGAVLILIGMKIYLTYVAHEKRKNVYQNPMTLAQEILSKRKKEMKTILEKIYDVTQLNLLLVRNFSVIQVEWENIKKGETKECDQLSERFRQAALFLSIMLIQHEKDPKPDVLRNKINFLEKMFRQYRGTLDEIKEAMDARKYFKGYESKSIANYYMDIVEVFDKHK